MCVCVFLVVLNLCANAFPFCRAQIVRKNLRIYMKVHGFYVISQFAFIHRAVFLFQLYGATEIYWFVWSLICPRQQPKNHVRLIRICAMASKHTLTTYHILSTAFIV